MTFWQEQSQYIKYAVRVAFEQWCKLLLLKAYNNSLYLESL